MANISFENVTKRFADGTVAVDSLTLEINDGEFIVLVGPSGSGKSTALRMAAGLEDITHGIIRVGGSVVNDLTPKERDMAMVFQNYALYPNMSVYGNMEFGLKLRKMPKQERKARVTAAAKMLGIGELLERRPAALSGGQRQRVAMGRAIVREPQAFLMDEPLSNLDAKLRVQMRTEIARVHQQLQTTTMFVTHDQTEAMTMGDRVAVLRDGTLQQLATPQELYESPTNLFVASFIGSPPMNLYEAEISGPANELVLSLGPQRLALSADVGQRRPGLVASTAREIVVGIRPELLTVTVGGSADHGPTLEAQVELVELLGNESLVHFSTDARMVRNRAGVWTADATTHGEIAGAVATEGVARVDPRVPVAVGDRVSLAVDISRLSFFDAETGDAIAGPSAATPATQPPPRGRAEEQGS